MTEYLMVDVLANDGWILYEKVEPGDCLRQGDLVEFNNDNPLKKFGLVVTADCDLVKKKHGRLITLVPVMSVKTVIEYYLLLEELDCQRNQLMQFVKEKFNCSFDNIKDPIQSAELRSKVNNLQSQPNMRLPCLAAKSILNDLDSISALEFSYLMGAIKVNIEKLPERIENKIRGKGDLIVLPNPTFLFNPVINIVWVRHIWQVPIRNIVFRNSEFDKKKGLGMCIARLDSPYRYRVTQLMGQVFSDIGTPDSVQDFSTTLKGILL